MTPYRFGDIVLIGFPYIDLRGVSKRPAIVLYDSGDQDILVARVTTQEYMSKGDYKILDWEKGGLLVESYVRLSKQATIDKRYIKIRIGEGLAAFALLHHRAYGSVHGDSYSLNQRTVMI
jgi:mRNA interferase MazF